MKEELDFSGPYFISFTGVHTAWSVSAHVELVGFYTQLSLIRYHSALGQKSKSSGSL